MKIIETAIMTISTSPSVGTVLAIIVFAIIGVMAAIVMSMCRDEGDVEVLIMSFVLCVICVTGALILFFNCPKEVEQEVYHVQLTDMSEEELNAKYDVLGQENGYWIIKAFDINDAKSESTNEQISVSTNTQEWRMNDIPGAFNEDKGILWSLKYDSKTLNVYIIYHQGYGFGITEYKSERGYPYKYNPETQELEEYVPDYIQQLLDAQN